jgi:acetyl esterase/lipase
MADNNLGTEATQGGDLQLGPRTLPPPHGASEVVRDSVAASVPADRKHEGPIPQTDEEWLAFVAAADEPAIAGARTLEASLPVTVERDEIAGVDVYHVVPDEISPAHDEHLFVHVHGGAYLLNGGAACVTEALLLAAGVGIRAVSIDYRMPPLHPYPTPVDDVVAVYLELLQRQRARSMVMGGSSAGGALTMLAVQQLLRDGMRVPGALFAGTPGSDMSGVGDSIHLNHDVDRSLPEFSGLVEAMAKLFANGIELTDPRVSPQYGDFDGFPPTLLVSGVRDILLSNTVRTHTRLLEAGTEAELIVFEGMSHADYLTEFSSPEHQLLLAQFDRFLTRHLQGSARRRTSGPDRVDSFRWA